MITEERLVEIEIKISRQEDMVDALNQVIYEQQKKIDRLAEICAVLTKHMQQSSDASGGISQDNERPPHY